MTDPRRALRWLLPVIGCLLVLAGCASTGGKANALHEAQYAYSAAIRWGDFEGAYTMLDPAYRNANPLTDLQLERYKQVQVSSYRDLAMQANEGAARREIQIGVVNRNTMAERTVRYTEAWRYDAASKAWLVTGGLPDFWAGE